MNGPVTTRPHQDAQEGIQRDVSGALSASVTTERSAVGLSVGEPPPIPRPVVRAGGKYIDSPPPSSPLEKSNFPDDGRERVSIWVDAETHMVVNKYAVYAVHCYLRCANWNKTLRMVKEKYPEFKSCEETLKKWLSRPHMQKYMKLKMREIGRANGLDETAWLNIGIEAMHGERELSAQQVEVWKTLGKAKKFIDSSENQQRSVAVNNQVFNFVQADGAI